MYRLLEAILQDQKYEMQKIQDPLHRALLLDKAIPVFVEQFLRH